MDNSTAKLKPPKPYSTFPLYAHASGRWAKKIKGRTHFFGPWRDPDGALEYYKQVAPDLAAGRKPQPRGSGEPDIRELCNRFLTAKKSRLAAGEITTRTFNDYFKVCEIVITEFGKSRILTDLRPADFLKLRSKLIARLLLGIRLLHR